MDTIQDWEIDTEQYDSPVGPLQRLPKFSFVGSYPLFYLSGADRIYCADCAAHVELSEGIISYGHAHYEGSDLECDEGCGAVIETAYGESEMYAPEKEDSEEEDNQW